MPKQPARCFPLFTLNTNNRDEEWKKSKACTWCCFRTFNWTCLNEYQFGGTTTMVMIMSDTRRFDRLKIPTFAVFIRKPYIDCINFKMQKLLLDYVLLRKLCHSSALWRCDYFFTVAKCLRLSSIWNSNVNYCQLHVNTHLARTPDLSIWKRKCNKNILKKTSQSLSST